MLVDKIDQQELGAIGNYKNILIQKKDISCNKLFESSVHDEPAPLFQLEPFTYIPDSFWHDFTYGNKILVTKYFFKDSFPTNRNSGKLVLKQNDSSLSPMK